MKITVRRQWYSNTKQIHIHSPSSLICKSNENVLNDIVAYFSVKLSMPFKLIFGNKLKIIKFLFFINPFATIFDKLLLMFGHYYFRWVILALFNHKFYNKIRRKLVRKEWYSNTKTLCTLYVTYTCLSSRIA